MNGTSVPFHPEDEGETIVEVDNKEAEETPQTQQQQSGKQVAQDTEPVVESGITSSEIEQLFIAVVRNRLVGLEDMLNNKHPIATMRDANGLTAVHYAAAYGQVSTMELLHQHGGDLWARSKHGVTPLNFAIQRGHEHAANYLIHHDSWKDSTEEANDWSVYLYIAAGMEQLSVVK